MPTGNKNTADVLNNHPEYIKTKESLVTLVQQHEIVFVSGLYGVGKSNLVQQTFPDWDYVERSAPYPDNTVPQDIVDLYEHFAHSTGQNIIVDEAVHLVNPSLPSLSEIARGNTVIALGHFGRGETRGMGSAVPDYFDLESVSYGSFRVPLWSQDITVAVGEGRGLTQQQAKEWYEISGGIARAERALTILPSHEKPYINLRELGFVWGQNYNTLPNQAKQALEKAIDTNSISDPAIKKNLEMQGYIVQGATVSLVCEALKHVVRRESLEYDLPDFVHSSYFTFR